jgi:rhodanese-related sulfurtransferase
MTNKMTLKQISAPEAKRLVDQGALLVDIREAGEYHDENIPDALNAPLSRLGETPVGGAPIVVFHCKSGARTGMNAQALAASTDAEAYILDGGIEAWKAAGYNVKRG